MGEQAREIERERYNRRRKKEGTSGGSSSGSSGDTVLLGHLVAGGVKFKSEERRKLSARACVRRSERGG